MNQQQAEKELESLRERLREIRVAKKWLQEFRVNAAPTVSAALAVYNNFLCDQEQKTLAMGNRIKTEVQKK